MVVLKEQWGKQKQKKAKPKQGTFQILPRHVQYQQGVHGSAPPTFLSLVVWFQSCMQMFQGPGISNIFGSESQDSLSQVCIMTSGGPLHTRSCVAYCLASVALWKRGGKVHDPFAGIFPILLMSVPCKQRHRHQIKPGLCLDHSFCVLTMRKYSPKDVTSIMLAWY